MFTIIYNKVVEANERAVMALRQRTQIVDTVGMTKIFARIATWVRTLKHFPYNTEYGFRLITHPY